MPNYLEDFEAKNSIYPVEINHMDIIGKTLEPGETLDLNVVASYRQTLTPEQKTINYRISIIASSITKEEWSSFFTFVDFTIIFVIIIIIGV